ncbi:MAG: hypothetical protein ACOH2V_00760 [Candidatus Saccharimonadaceae bacterium]
MITTPITVGTTAVVAIVTNPKRVSVRFQNAGATILYFSRAPFIPSTTSYEFSIGATAVGDPDAAVSTDSVAQFNVISSAAGGILSMFETART